MTNNLTSHLWVCIRQYRRQLFEESFIFPHITPMLIFPTRLAETMSSTNDTDMDILLETILHDYSLKTDIYSRKMTVACGLFLSLLPKIVCSNLVSVVLFKAAQNGYF